MNRIKYSLFFLIIFLIGHHAISQNTIGIVGQVKGISTNLGIPNHQVIIYSQIDTSTSTGMNYYSSVFTLNNGLFLDSVTIPTGQNIKFRISTFDCHNNLVIDTFYSMYPSQIQLNICDSGFNLCQADYLTYPDTANHKKVFFVNLSIPSNAMYQWNFGDGDSSSVKNPVHTYANDSTYFVTLTVSDSAASCFSQRSDSIKVSPVFNCKNNFTHNSTFLNAMFFGTVNNSLPTIYNWNFGDFSTATGQNPTHSFAHAGIYKVSLQTISVNPQNMDTCIAHSFKHITIQSPPVGNIWGQVFADTGKVKLSEVYLYRYKDTISGYIPFDTVDVTVIDSLNLSFYYFNSIPYGKYLTKARLKDLSSMYHVFGPSYHGNTFRWEDAEPFELNQSGLNKPIHLTTIHDLSGTVKVMGRVLEGTQKNPGDPVAGVLLFLYDVQDDVYGYTISNQNGEYEFDGLNFRKYYIYADVLNKQVLPPWVWPNEGSLLLSDINIYIGKDKVTSMNETNLIAAKLFPNPAKDELFVITSFETPVNCNITIYNALGQQIEAFEETLGKDSGPTKISTSMLPTGLYTLQISSSDYSPISLKFIVE